MIEYKSDMRYLYYLIFIFAYPSLTFGQYFTEKYTVGEGLSQQDVTCIYEDERGFIWVGTNGGLNRFDGYNFKTYKPGPTTNLSSNLIGVSICEDNLGNMWVATKGGGLNQYNPQTDKFTSFRHDENDTTSLSDDYITNLYYDSRNILWIATKEGIDFINLQANRSSLEFNHFSGDLIVDKNTNSKIFCEQDSGYMWITGKDGRLCKLEMEEKSEEEGYKIKNIKFYTSPLNNYVKIYPDTLGKLFITSRNGFWLFDPKKESNQFEKIYNTNFIQDFSYDVLNDLAYILSNNEIIIAQHFNRNTLVESSNQIQSDTIKLNQGELKRIYNHRPGLIWIGTVKNGVIKLQSKRHPFKTFTISEEGGKNIFRDSHGHIWFGTFSNIYRSRKPTYSFNLFEQSEFNKLSLPEEFIASSFAQTVYSSGVSDIWIGSGTSGLYRTSLDANGNIKDDFYHYTYDPGNSHGLSNDIVQDIISDREGRLWIATYIGGLSLAIPSEDSPHLQFQSFLHDPNDPLSISSNEVRCLFQDDSNNIWVGTSNGLNKVVEVNGKYTFEKYQNEPNDLQSISNNYILHIFQSSKKQLWIGTLGGGLNRMLNDSTERKGVIFERYTEQNGKFPNNTIKSILEDQEGNLWMGTNIGIIKFNPAFVASEIFNVKDGVINYELEDQSACKLNNGVMIFGSVNGFTSFNPASITSEPNSADIYITKLKVFNKPIDAGQNFNGRILLKKDISFIESLIFKPKENSFGFEFSVLDFHNPDKVQYKYKLEGFDKDWITTSSNSANYTNIPPGTYQFKVWPYSGVGEWKQTPASISITVSTPFYQSTIAIISYLLIVLSFFYFFQKYTFIKQQKKHELLMEHYQKEKMEELNQMKMSFFTNITHEFRTPISLILTPAQRLLQNLTLSREDVENYLITILNNSRYLLRLINQLMEFRKLEQGELKLNLDRIDIIDFLERIVDSFIILAQRKDIKVNFSHDISPIHFITDTDKFEMIVNNILSNAIKYTRTGGKIDIEVFIENDISKKNLKIIIKDTGVGIPEESLPYIFKRFYRADTSINGHGTGIGLFFTHSLIQRLHGQIQVQSKVNHGTNFSVSLPFIFEKIKEDDLAPINDSVEILPTYSLLKEYQNSRKNTPINPSPGDFKALIVEDNYELRHLLIKEFKTDYRVIEAANGKEAMQYLDKELPDIVITDLMMPECDGFCLCRNIKTNLTTSHIPVIMLTAKTQEEDLIKGIQEGADDYVTKPFSIQYLKLKVANLIESRMALKEKYAREIGISVKNICFTSLDEQLLKKIKEIIDNRLDDLELSVSDLSKEIGMSRSLLYNKIKSLSGLGPSEFIRNYRLKVAAKYLKDSPLQVKEIMYMTGFSSSSYFSKCFKKLFGVKPLEFKKKEYKLDS